MREAALAGDVTAMKVATRALEALVGAGDGERASVVDLGAERAKRGRSE